MTSKYCTKCKTTKHIKMFCKNKMTKDGLSCHCKSCLKISTNHWKITRAGVISTIFNCQRAHSKIKGVAPPSYSKEEFAEWVYKQINFDCLYLNWINSGFDTNKKPSGFSPVYLPLQPLPWLNQMAPSWLADARFEV